MKTFRVTFLGYKGDRHEKIEAYDLEAASRKVKKRFKGEYLGFMIEEVRL